MVPRPSPLFVFQVQRVKEVKGKSNLTKSGAKYTTAREHKSIHNWMGDNCGSLEDLIYVIKTSMADVEKPQKVYRVKSNRCSMPH